MLSCWPLCQFSATLFYHANVDVAPSRRTFHAGYFVAVIAGLGVGEAIFGRWG